MQQNYTFFIVVHISALILNALKARTNAFSKGVVKQTKAFLIA